MAEDGGGRIVDVIGRVKETIQSEGYGAALAILEEAEGRLGAAPPMLVWKGLCMQMDEAGRFDLSEAERCFKEALDVDPESVDALVELGWHYENMLDEPALAEPYFRRALAVCRCGATQALIGLSRVLKGLARTAEAGALLDNPSNVAVDLERVREEMTRP